MPKRRLQDVVAGIEASYAKKLEKKAQCLHKVVAQIERSVEFAKEGDIQSSLNILNTLDHVFDVSGIMEDFVASNEPNDFLRQLEILVQEKINVMDM